MADVYHWYPGAIEFHTVQGRRQPVTYSKRFADTHPNENLVELPDGRFYRCRSDHDNLSLEASRTRPTREVKALQQSWRIQKSSNVAAMISTSRPAVEACATHNELHSSQNSSTENPVVSRQRQKVDYTLQAPESYPNTGRPLNQEHPERCEHAGSCGKKCPCTLNKAPCRLGCGCMPECERRFSPCACNGPCVSCPCVIFGWACTPNHCACNNCSNAYLPSSAPKLMVATSTIPNAGKGVFALEHIKEGNYLGDYTGKLVSLSNLKTHDCGRVSIFQTSKGDCGVLLRMRSAYIDAGYGIDGDTGHSPLVYANHHATDANMVYEIVEMPHGRVPVGIAAKDIRAGQEILVNYE